MSKLRRIKPEMRRFVNPTQFQGFLDGSGALSNRNEVAQDYGYDWHSRKLTFEKHFNGHVLMQVTKYRSMRDHQWAAENDPLFAAMGADMEISVSGLAQANKNRPIGPLIDLLQQVVDTVSRLPHRRLRNLDKETWQGIVDLISRADILDATVLPLPPKVAEELPGLLDDKAALKLQARIDAETGNFRHLELTKATGPDAPYLDALLHDLPDQRGQIYIFDGGYWGIERYHRIAEQNDFVCKRGGNIKPHFVKALPLPAQPLPCGYTVLADDLVRLGDENERLFRRLRVRLSGGAEITLLSSMVDASAAEICALYHYRWTIEILFRWLKQLLQLDTFMSHDARGILRQILMALIVWGMLVLARQDDGSFSPKQLWRQLQADLHTALFNAGYQLGMYEANASP